MADNKVRRGVVLAPTDLDTVNWLDYFDDNLNLLGIHSGGGESHNVIDRLGVYGTEEFRKICRERNIDFEYELHAPQQLMDYSLFAEHPEYFYENSRLNERMDNGNWCVSSPALELVAKNAVMLADKLPCSTNRFFYWGVDKGGEDWCHCDKCSKLNAADQCLATANAMVQELRKSNPDAVVGSIFYLATMQLPSSVEPVDGVIAEYAPYRRCYKHTLDDPDCAVNREYYRRFKEIVSMFGADRTHVLEYHIDSSYASVRTGCHRRCPCRDLDTMKRDIAVYARHGITSFTSFAVDINKEYLDLYGDTDIKNYLEAIKEIQ